MTMTHQLYRFAYASHSTFQPFATTEGVDVNIAQILEVARKNNQKNNLVGALYYGNGCFFQCLEGSKQDIDALHSKLLNDSRHKDLKVLLSEPIEKSGFSSWEMKFATIDHEVRAFLREHNVHKFDPYQFDLATTKQLVDMLQKADDALNTKELAQAASVPIEHKNHTNIWVFIVGLLVAFFAAFTLITA
jgi:predicted Ser/Thr protein kinase